MNDFYGLFVLVFLLVYPYQTQPELAPERICLEEPFVMLDAALDRLEDFGLVVDLDGRRRRQRLS